MGQGKYTDMAEFPFSHNLLSGADADNYKSGYKGGTVFRKPGIIQDVLSQQGINIVMGSEITYPS